MGKVIVVASGKGGTGKTSFCAGLAVALCAQGERVLDGGEVSIRL